MVNYIRKLQATTHSNRPPHLFWLETMWNNEPPLVIHIHSAWRQMVSAEDVCVHTAIPIYSNTASKVETWLFQEWGCAVDISWRLMCNYPWQVEVEKNTDSSCVLRCFLYVCLLSLCRKKIKTRRRAEVGRGNWKFKRGGRGRKKRRRDRNIQYSEFSLSQKSYLKNNFVQVNSVQSK